jgi:hypothetical protein
MLLGVSRLRRAVIVVPVVALACLAMISCGKSSSPNSGTTGLKFRAFISQDVTNATGTAGASVLIVDANRDLVAGRVGAGAGGGLLGSSFLPTTMIESSNHQITLAISLDNTQVQVINNSTEAASGTVNLSPAYTQSIVISPDVTSAYAASPTMQIPGGTPGAVAVISLSTGQISSKVPVPGAQYVVESGDGSRLLAFSNNKDLVNTITIVSPFNIIAGQQNALCPTAVTAVAPTQPVCQFVSGFDHPIFGFFSSDNTIAWILNCGPQCGGQQASVQVLDLVHGTAGVAVPVDAATVGFVNNQTLYVAGTPTTPPGGSTPADNSCTGITTAAPTCGRLDVVDLPSMTVTNHLVITDGYHTQMNMQNGQLFVGSKTCSNVFLPTPTSAGEQRGCLSIVNTVPSAIVQGDVIFPPDNGDVTGLQPITNRTIMYVIEGGAVRIYDTTTDKIFPLTSITIVGNAVDVKLADF